MSINIPRLIDYIKNVATSELYPTWPEDALRANIYTIVSIGLEPTGTVNYATWDKLIEVYLDLRYSENRLAGRYPGLKLGGS